jgi:hypothetical protein
MPTNRVSDAVRSTHNQDGAVVLDILHGRVLRLNTTASLIFYRLQQGQTNSQIVDEMCREFCVSREIAQADLAEFLDSLARQGLVQGQTAERYQ